MKYFDILSIDFVGLFPSCLVINILWFLSIISKWVKEKDTHINDAKVVDFVKTNIFVMFDTPKYIISDMKLIFAIRLWKLCSRNLALPIECPPLIIHKLTVKPRCEIMISKAFWRKL